MFHKKTQLSRASGYCATVKRHNLARLQAISFVLTVSSALFTTKEMVKKLRKGRLFICVPSTFICNSCKPAFRSQARATKDPFHAGA